MKKKRESDKDRTDDDAVFLEDLMPREDVRGGSGKIRFGQEPAARPVPPPSDSKKRRGE